MCISVQCNGATIHEGVPRVPQFYFSGQQLGALSAKASVRLPVRAGAAAPTSGLPRKRLSQPGLLERAHLRLLGCNLQPWGWGPQRLAAGSGAGQ